MEKYETQGTQGDPLRGQIRDTTSQARGAVKEGLDETRRAKDDFLRNVQEKSRVVADRASDLAAEGKRRVIRAAREVGSYAGQNTAIVAVTMVAVGILIGRYLVPSSD